MRRTFLLLAMIVGFACAHARPVDTLSWHSLEFVPNAGQWNSKVLYSARMHGGCFFVEKNSFTVALISPEQLHQFYENKFKSIPQKPLDAFAYSMSFLDASPESFILPQNSLPHYYNYFIGKDPSQWASRVPVYQDLVYRDLYPGIDLHLTQSHHSLKYEYVVSPHTDISQIRVAYSDGSSLKLSDGHLIVNTPISRIVELPPFAYQIITGDTVPVECHYKLEKNIVSFQVDAFNADFPLVIDPVVVFSSYSGSESDNWGYTATYDADGNLYGGGICFGANYPTTLGAYQIDFAGGRTDISISKFNAQGTNLVYSTYLGGSNTDIPHSLYVNDNGELYVFGTTGSSDFPVTANAFDTTFNGGPQTTLSTSLNFNFGSDIIVSKFSASGNALLAST